MSDGGKIPFGGLGDLWAVLRHIETSEIPGAVAAVQRVWSILGNAPTWDGAWITELGDAVVLALAEGSEVTRDTRDDVVAERFVRSWPHFRMGVLEAFREAPSA